MVRGAEATKRTNPCLSELCSQVTRMTLRALRIRSATGAKRASTGLVRREHSELVPIWCDRPERSEVVPVVIFATRFLVAQKNEPIKIEHTSPLCLAPIFGLTRHGGVNG